MHEIISSSYIDSILRIKFSFLARKIMEKQAVYGVLFNEDRSKVLLVLRRDLPVWVLPGGGLDPAETAAEGVCREVEEETGFQVKVTRQIATYLPVNKLTQKTFFFECAICGGTAKENAEAKKVAFFAIDDLPSRLAPPFAGWIQDALSCSPTLIVKKVEGVSYFVLIKLLITHPILVIRYLLTKLGIRFNDKS
jgi:8-oxo-dGTP diphosphatase